jgi:hypothetical protein
MLRDNRAAMKKRIWHPKEWRDGLLALSAFIIASVLVISLADKVLGRMTLGWTPITILLFLYVLMFWLGKHLYGKAVFGALIGMWSVIFSRIGFGVLRHYNDTALMREAIVILCICLGMMAFHWWQLNRFQRLSRHRKSR